MKTYLEYIQEDTAVQRLYKKKGYFRGFVGPIKAGDEGLADYIENKEKASYVEKLEQYKDDENVYISYRSLPLAGINPKSTFKTTPNGLYCYPLKEEWLRVQSNMVEYGSNPQINPYVAIIKIKEGYTWDTANNPDTKILTTHLTNQTRINKVCRDFSKYAINKCEEEQLVVLLKKIKNILSSKCVLGVEDFSKDNPMVTEENKNDPSAYGPLDCYNYIHKENYNKSFAIKIVESLMLKVFSVYGKTGNAIFQIIWEFSRDVSRAKLGYTDEHTGTPSSKNEYSSIIKRKSDVFSYILFNVLGFSMVINREDEGIIHNNELNQAVIFDHKCYTHEIIDNSRKDNKEYNSNKEINEFKYGNKNRNMKRLFDNVLFLYENGFVGDKSINITNFLRANDITLLNQNGSHLYCVKDLEEMCDIEKYFDEILKLNTIETKTYNYLYNINGIKALMEIDNNEIKSLKGKPFKDVINYFILEKDIYGLGFRPDEIKFFMSHIGLTVYTNKNITIKNNSGIKVIICSDNSFENSNIENVHLEIDNDFSGVNLVANTISNSIMSIKTIYDEDAVVGNTFKNCQLEMTIGRDSYEDAINENNTFAGCDVNYETLYRGKKKYL